MSTTRNGQSWCFRGLAPPEYTENMPETEGQPRARVELQEEVCNCGHTAGCHVDPTDAWERGEQTTGRCREENCECPGFELFEE